MISLSELLFGPQNLPSALPGDAADGTGLPLPGAFARTLTDARTALGAAVPGEDTGEGAMPAALPLPGLQQAPALMQERSGAAAGLQMPGLSGLAALSFTGEDPRAQSGQGPVAADPALSTTLPGLPQPQMPSAGSTELETIEALPSGDAEPAALPAMLSADARGPWALRMAVRATTTEGTGQGSPGGNGLPPLGPDGGKALPDLPPARFQTVPAPAGTDAAAATTRVAATTPAAATVAAATALAAVDRPSLPQHPGVPVSPVAQFDQAATRGAAAAAAAGDTPSPGARTPSPGAREAAALVGIQQDRGPGLDPRLQGAQTEARLAGVGELAQRAVAAAEAVSAERPATVVSAPGAQTRSHLPGSTATAAAGVLPGAPGNQAPGTSAAGPAPLSAAMPEALAERSAAAGQQGEPTRQLGAVELRALSASEEGAADVRRPAGSDLPSQGQPGLRQEFAAQMDSGAVAAVIDRRTIADAAGQRRGAEQQASGTAESVDRSPATGTEAAEQSSRPQTARPVMPVLAARDLTALAERIEMLVHRRGGVASVNLTLSELGDVEISVRMESKQAHVQFLVQDATARESLEAQLPRLRALLNEGGLELGDVGMNMRERSGGEAGSEGDDRRPGTPRTALADGGSVEEPSSRRRSGGDEHVLDAFA